jgi:heparosan-N-sulfate-glucuronate 5-epimerase
MKYLSVFLVFVIVYLLSAFYRALYYIEDDNYIFEPFRLADRKAYPVTFTGFRSSLLTSVDENGIIFRDFDKVANLAAPKGEYYSPIASGFKLVHEITYVEEKPEDRERLKLIERNLEWLLDIQQKPSGTWLINFDNHISGRVNKGPWVSGLGQGVLISALVQGYYLFGKESYLNSAIMGAQAMLRPISHGGTISRNSYGKVIEEYPFEDNNIHVLNGYLYSVIALAQLMDIEPGFKAAFEYHTDQISRLLPQYVLPGGWSAYSLDEPTLRNHATYANPNYHDLHTAQLAYLCYMTNDTVICDHSRFFEEYKNSIAAYSVSFAYVIFRDLVSIYKELTH